MMVFPAKLRTGSDTFFGGGMHGRRIEMNRRHFEERSRSGEDPIIQRSTRLEELDQTIRDMAREFPKKMLGPNSLVGCLLSTR